ncbi:hypothetical protein BGZ46_003331, partial [Entomortierella lignicola]
MGILSHLSSSSKHTPKEWIAQANAELENVHREKNPKKALDLTQNAKSKIQKAEKSFSSARAKDLSQDDGTLNDIANAYHEHGELLDKLGHSKMAQESHSKTQNYLGPLIATPSSVTIDHQNLNSNMTRSSTGTLAQKTTIIKVEK